VGWKTLRHPNVLPLLGVTMAETRFVTVSEWMVNGTIMEFVREHASADRLSLVCFPIGTSSSFAIHNLGIAVVERRR
jgi:hypothetical protein